jgi:hypothetical protein
MKIMNSNNKATVPKVNDSSHGTAFYYLATCLLLLLILDKPYENLAKGFRLYLYKVKRVCKFFLANLLLWIFKYIDKYYKNKEEC